MPQDTRVTELAQAIGVDIGTLIDNIGSLASLPTTDKTSLVASLTELYNEVQTLASSGGAVINDAATTSTTATYSIDKILDIRNDLRDEILGPDNSAALDTIKELATELLSQDAALDNLLTTVANTVRFTSQSLTAPQQLQARTNIAAASQADLDALETAVGSTETDYVSIYNAAKA